MTVLDGVHICAGAAIAPGSVVTPRKTVGMGEVWAGIPARKVRDLSAAEKAEIMQMCNSIAEVYFIPHFSLFIHRVLLSTTRRPPRTTSS